MSPPFVPPTFRQAAFNCPSCSAYANQRWAEAVANSIALLKDQHFAICTHCNTSSYWIGGELIHPAPNPVGEPNSDLSDDIQRDFNEARSIVSASPRGAAALLRLCVQKICKSAGEPGKNINDDIGALVKKGLPVKVQQALDTVRVIGNNAVHPGQLDLRDDAITAQQLFILVNLIADVLISQPRHIEQMYQSLVPESQRNAIERRDS